MEILNESQITEYCKNNFGTDKICYCKDCGKLIEYNNKTFAFHPKTKELMYRGNLSFLSTRDYNGHTYRLCRCYNCVCKKFPEFKDVKFKFAHKAAKYTQYGFDVPDEDFNVVSKERQSVTKEKMIKKYGEEEGNKRRNNYCNKQSITNTFEYKHEKFGMSKEEFYDYNLSRAVTKENLIKKYGEEKGLIKWNEYCEKQRYTTTKEYFIEKYGEKDGLIKYDSFCKKRAESAACVDRYSKVSLELFEKLSSLYNHKDKILYGEKEYEINTLGGHYYFVDYFDKVNYIIIEFFGDFFHFNPKKYKGNEKIKSLCDNWEYPQDKWKKDKDRLEDIYNTTDAKIIVIWESTYRENKKDLHLKIKELIDNKEKLDPITYL